MHFPNQPKIPLNSYTYIFNSSACERLYEIYQEQQRLRMQLEDLIEREGLGGDAKTKDGAVHMDGDTVAPQDGSGSCGPTRLRGRPCG